MRSVPIILLASLLASLGSGCGTADDRGEARTATERFYEAVRVDDGEVACAELAEDAVKQLESQSGQACADAVVRLEYEGGEIRGVEVYATSATVELSSGESAFLSPESGEWKLSAVGCKPEEGKPRDRPLDCEVEA